VHSFVEPEVHSFVEPEVHSFVEPEVASSVEPELASFVEAEAPEEAAVGLHLYAEPQTEEHPFVAETPADEPYHDETSLPASMLRFGVVDGGAEAPRLGFESYGSFDRGSTEGGFGSAEPMVAGADEAPAGMEPDAEDRYAALRAAILEVKENESLVDPTAAYASAAGTDGEPYSVNAEPSGRAALHALLNEVSGPEAAADGSGWVDREAVQASEPVDGLADRGPWTEHELASMDAPSWSTAEGGELVAHAAPTEVAEAVEEPAAAQDEPMNRGLLLKFLSSVRN
jgi:hypothetical protein